ncbi:MAG: energy transducer TonB, partial [Myxococcota bacterium]|nr:energy transducer TonB [Myxococcota bacterium]
GLRVRYGAGNPYTPIVNSIFDLNRREFIPVYGSYDSGRLPAFFSLDARIDKEYIFDRWVLTAYLDIQNLSNAANVEVMSWNYDYSEEDPIAGNPLFPAFGFKGEW